MSRADWHHALAGTMMLGIWVLATVSYLLGVLTAWLVLR